MWNILSHDFLLQSTNESFLKIEFAGVENIAHGNKTSRYMGTAREEEIISVSPVSPHQRTACSTPLLSLTILHINVGHPLASLSSYMLGKAGKTKILLYKVWEKNVQSNNFHNYITLKSLQQDFSA